MVRCTRGFRGSFATFWSENDPNPLISALWHPWVLLTQVCVDLAQLCVHYTQMRVRRLTAVDVCEVSGYNRDQLRGLLQELPKWSSAPGERRARAYSRHDLIVLAVVHTLDVTISMRRKAIAAVFPLIQAALSGPKPIAKSARLAIAFSPRLQVEYLDDGSIVPEGVVVVLQPILDRVDRYLSGVQVQAPDPQADLELGPGLVRGRRRGSAT